MRPQSGSGVTAVLGPTNTGKTFLAIERMVAHSSGVIGLPLRLLAREVYQKVVDRVGAANVALITGEEKIKPKNARFHVCTVEAMPRKTDAAFVAIDEVQLAGDLERGHIFTDRILHTRGHSETLLLGSGSMRGVLERLLPGIQVVTRPRMSQLLYAGQKKTTRLPRRSAIVAFSADEVYAIAELIRRQRGGAAVVMGALSPRTRNAQVQLYQSGDVDFLVATDAIGMGLNLDVDHVAFAQDWKYDGFQYRQLTPAELGQIAGRAGRHLRDGTFGVTGRVDPMADELVGALEAHAFPPVRVLQWRSDQLDFGSIDRLKASLDVVPNAPELTRALPAVDARALDFLSRDPFVVDRTTNASRVETLWEACKLPDYRRIAPAQHAEIIATVYGDLVGRGHVAEDYMAAQVLRADQMEGDIDTLSRRIAEIRTWTYISHRPEWLADPSHWQEKTRDIEDRLSDALHERLTKRFVDRRTSVLMKRLRENASMEAEIGVDGKVLVEGHHVGELQGFRFSPDTKADGPDAKAVRAAAQKALAGEFDSRAERFSNAPNGDLALGQDGLLRWLGAPIASLTSGEDAMTPRVVLLADEQLTGPARDKVAARAERFVTYQVSTILKPLMDLKSAEGLEGTARGIAYRLVENFGLLQRRDISEDVRSLDQDARAALRRHGVRFGAYHIFVPALVKPAPANLLTLLWAIAKDGRDKPGFGDVTHLLSTGRTSAVADPAFDPIFYALAGYRLLGRRAVRIDILERLADLIRPALAWKPGTTKRPEGGFNGSQFLVTPAMMSILGATADDMEEILRGLGYRSQGIDAKEIEKTIARQDEEAFAAEAAKANAAVAAAAEAARGVLAPVDGETEASSEAAPVEEAASGAAAPSETAASVEASSETPAAKDGRTDDAHSEDGQAEDARTEDALTAAAAQAADGVLAPGLDDAAEPAAPSEAVEAAEVDAAEAATAEPSAESREEADAPASEATESSVPSSDEAAVEVETAAQDAPVSVGAAPVEAVAPVEVKLVQVWRPQRHEGRGGARDGRGGDRAGGRQRPGGRQPGRGSQPAEAGAEGAPADAVAREARPEGERSGGRPFRQGGRGPGGGNAPGGDRGPRSFGGKGGDKPGGTKDGRGEGRGEGRENRREGFGGDKRPNRADNRTDNRADKAPGGETRRFESKAPARIDPDSPFAKLAALKDKLGK